MRSLRDAGTPPRVEGGSRSCALLHGLRPPAELRLPREAVSTSGPTSSSLEVSRARWQSDQAFPDFQLNCGHARNSCTRALARHDARILASVRCGAPTTARRDYPGGRRLGRLRSWATSIRSARRLLAFPGERRCRGEGGSGAVKTRAALPPRGPRPLEDSARRPVFTGSSCTVGSPTDRYGSSCAPGAPGWMGGGLSRMPGS